MSYYLDHNKLSPVMRKVAQAAFPNYSGRKFQVTFAETVNCRSYWDGGSRDYYVFVRLDNFEKMAAPTSHPYFNRDVQNVESVPLQPGLVCVQHSIFCGKDTGLTFILHPSASNLIPAPDNDLTRNEKIVLAATASLKSSYAGISNYRFHSAHNDTGISADDWESAVNSLIGKGLLRKNKAITPEGRNAIGNTRLYNLK